jgi:hypothetical protein
MGREKIPAVNQGGAMRWRVSLGLASTVARSDPGQGSTVAHGFKNAVRKALAWISSFSNSIFAHPVLFAHEAAVCSYV